MKNLIIACLLIISVLTAGCGGGGGSSTKPTVIVTAPTISDVATESTSTHTVATISGIGFGSPVSSSYVTYDGKQYSTNDWYDNKIVVTVPFSTVDPFKFRVVVNNVTSNPPLNATNNMRIFSISPSSGNPGTDVTISGQGFGVSQVLGAYFVTFHNPSQQSDTPYPQAIISNWSDTSITCKVPTDSKLLQSGSGQVVVTVWKSSSNYVSSYFNLILPQISYIDPNVDNVGATIKIHGTGFGSSQTTSQGASQVRIGGNYAQVVNWADSIIEARVPDFSTAGQKTIEMTINNRTISNTNFSVAGPENVQGYYPAGQTSIGQGETFTITGRHFGAATDFDGSYGYTRSIQVTASGNLYNVSSVNWSDTQITFSWPVPNSIGNKTAAVTINIGGLSATISNIQAE